MVVAVALAAKGRYALASVRMAQGPITTTPDPAV
jgi:hypothetical protein